MDAKFDAQNNAGQQPVSAMEAIDSQKRDRFELLSAYLDGEVSAAERKQVQYWLDTDPKVQQLHRRLLKLRQGLRTLPVPSEQPVEKLQDNVFTIYNRRRLKKVSVWGGSAIAALVIGAVSVFSPGNFSLVPNIASSPEKQTESESAAILEVEPLTIAINQPAVAIPKSAVSQQLSE